MGKSWSTLVQHLSDPLRAWGLLALRQPQAGISMAQQNLIMTNPIS